MNTDSLRTRTREQHEAVEALLPVMDADLSPDRYVEALRCMYRAVKPWEDWASLHAPSRFAALAAERRRAHLLEADLRFWHSELPVGGGTEALETLLLKPAASQPAGEATFLGAMYVVEGSTLGGQHIARHVEERLALQPGQGDAFFRGYGEQTGTRWRQFKELLQAVPEEQADTVVAAAQAMFGFFGEAFRPGVVTPSAPARSSGRP